MRRAIFALYGMKPANHALIGRSARCLLIEHQPANDQPQRDRDEQATASIRVTPQSASLVTGGKRVTGHGLRKSVQT